MSLSDGVHDNSPFDSLIPAFSKGEGAVDGTFVMHPIIMLPIQ